MIFFSRCIALIIFISTIVLSQICIYGHVYPYIFISVKHIQILLIYTAEPLLPLLHAEICG